MSADRRDQARLRQARKRQRDREARFDVQAIAIADRMPPAWRKDFLERVKRNREGKERASIQVNKAAASIPDEHRAEFLASHRQNTKVSLAEIQRRFVREKSKAKQWPEKEPETDDWVPPSRDVSVPLLNGMQIQLDREEVIPGSWLWWTIALDGEGGLSDKRRNSGMYPSRHFNEAAMAFLGAQRSMAAASKCHCACVTSRPEYWLVASRPPVRFFVR
jgi:hypothetical protein